VGRRTVTVSVEDMIGGMSETFARCFHATRQRAGAAFEMPRIASYRRSVHGVSQASEADTTAIREDPQAISSHLTRRQRSHGGFPGSGQGCRDCRAVKVDMLSCAPMQEQLGMARPIGQTVVQGPGAPGTNPMEVLPQAD